MAIHRLKIVGVHYAVNPESTPQEEETEMMHKRTASRLNELNLARPIVVLMPEPTNPVDARAVMARTEGRRIGYVEKSQLDVVHALFEAQGGRPLMARIEGVEAKKHGWLNVCVETEAEVLVSPQNACGEAWQKWVCQVPVLPCEDARFACLEAETVLDEALASLPREMASAPSQEALLKLQEGVDAYLRLWLENALHDLSYEALLTREHYISRLKEITRTSPHPKLLGALTALEKQRTALCGNKRMALRIEVWWKALYRSKEMELLWDSWLARIGGNLEQGEEEMNAALQTLPFDLGGLLNHRGLFFSRLHYTQVPRAVFWQIVSLLLLRERTLHERRIEAPRIMNRAAEKMPEGEAIPFEVVMPKELETPEAKRVLAKLQKKGYLDADFQPSRLVGWERGTLAFEVTDYLGIKFRWAVMASLWKMNPSTLRQYHSQNFTESKVADFSKKIKSIIYSS